MQDWTQMVPAIVVMMVAMICSTFLIVDHFIAPSEIKKLIIRLLFKGPAERAEIAEILL